jgi:predicted permease
MQALTAMLAMGRPDFTLRAELNSSVLAATIAVSLISALAFGLAPALRSTKLNVFSSLRASQSSPGNPKRRWMPINLGQALIVAQIALSFLLLMGAGLFVRTLSKLQSIELGFNPNNLLIFEINTLQAGYKHAPSIAFHEQLRQKLAAIPGVVNATLAAGGQLDGGNWSLDFTVPGSVFPDAENKKETMLLPVGPDYLATMQIPMLAGRDITLEDQTRASTAAVVSESFAKKHFGSISAALGRHTSMNFDGDQDVEIVGVAKDARYPDLKTPMPAMLYVDYRHQVGFASQFIRVVLRTAGDPAQTATAARQILRQADPGVPMGMMYTQQMTIDSTIIQEILFYRLCAAFALLAVIIACVGLYGTTAYSVGRRTSEIGIRMALGAQRKTVLAMVLREVALLGIAGLAIGVPIALAMSSLVESFLYKVQPRDPLTIAGAIAAMLLGALLSAYVPAQRASRIDPMTALRHE